MREGQSIGMNKSLYKRQSLAMVDSPSLDGTGEIAIEEYVPRIDNPSHGSRQNEQLACRSNLTAPAPLISIGEDISLQCPARIPSNPPITNAKTTMANTRQNVVNPISAIIDVPDPVKKFGQDDGKFYRCYDALAEEIDEEMAKGLKEQLDGLLVFVSN